VNRVKGHIPGAGGVLYDRDLVPIAVDQPRNRVVDRLEARFALIRCFIPADLGLALEVPDRDIDHRLRHQ